MRESLKTLLTPDYIWDDIKHRKIYKHNGIFTALLGIPVILGFIPTCWIWAVFSDIHIGVVFWIIVLGAYAIILPLTVIICKKVEQRLLCRRKDSIDSVPAPLMEIGEDICIRKDVDLGDSDSYKRSYILHFEKAGKIGNPRKHNLVGDYVNIGEKFYTVRIPNTREPLRFYSAKAYRLRDLTKEELAEEDHLHSEKEQQLFVALVNLESQP